MGWVIFLVISGMAVLALMKYAGSDRRAGKAIRGKGRTGPAKLCPDCGLPRGKCRKQVADAEHPAGMVGKRKKLQGR